MTHTDDLSRDTIIANCRDTFEVAHIERDDSGKIVGYNLHCICGDPDERFHLVLHEGVNADMKVGDTYKVDVKASPVLDPRRVA